MSLYLLNDMKKSWKERIIRIEANHSDAGMVMPSIRQLPKCRQAHSAHWGSERELAQVSRERGKSECARESHELIFVYLERIVLGIEIVGCVEVEVRVSLTRKREPSVHTTSILHAKDIRRKSALRLPCRVPRRWCEVM